MPLVWNGASASARETDCPVCHAHVDMKLFVSTANPWRPEVAANYHRCPDCRSLVVIDGYFPDIMADEEAQTSGWRDYVQIGAGLEAMMSPIDRLVLKDRPSLLDIGCGFGFTLDYWRRALGGRSVGVDPSFFARIGRSLLVPDLHVGYLDEIEAIRGERFDVVFSGEVIEHVDDPAGFLRQLRGFLEPDGTLVLTTPNAGYIDATRGVAQVLAVLSPGVHRMLFSEHALRRHLDEAGFSHVVIEHDNERFVAWASDRELRFRAPDASSRERMIGYLVERAADPGLDTDLALGFGYRAVRELVNHGRVAEAAPIMDRLGTAIRTRFGVDLSREEGVLGAVLPITDKDEYERTVPFSLGCLLFYQAMIARQSGPSSAASACGFELAYQVMAHSLRMAPASFQEAARLVWIAILERGLALLDDGRAEQAATCLSVLLPEADPDGRADCPIPVPAPVMTRALLESARANLACERPEAAIAQAGAFLVRHPAGDGETRRALDVVARATALAASRMGEAGQAAAARLHPGEDLAEERRLRLAAEDQRAALRKQLADIHRSTSWTATTPLRVIGNWIKGRRG